MKHVISRFLLSILSVLTLCACHSDEDVVRAEDDGDNAFTVTRRIALFVTPESRASYETVVGMALAHINEAQAGSQEQLKLKVEWYEATSTSSYRDNMRAMVSDEDVPIIIGPDNSILAAYLADSMAVYRDSHSQSEKMLILPICTSAKLQRAHCDREFLWCLTGCDIMQSNMLLQLSSQLLYKPAVTLINTDDIYGATFYDWCPFAATEFGVENYQNYQLPVNPTREQVEAIMRGIAERNIKRNEGLSAYEYMGDAVIIASTDIMVYQVCDSMAYEMFLEGHLICPFATDIGFDERLIPHYRMMMGLYPSADPESIFGDEYIQKNGHLPQLGEAQLYDAIVLSFLSLYHAHIQEQKGTHRRLYDAMCDIVDADAEDKAATYTTWNKEDMRVMVEMLGQGENLPTLEGCTSSLDFTDKHHTTVVDNYYTVWRVRDGKSYLLDTYTYQDAVNENWDGTWEWVAGVTDPSADYLDPAWNNDFYEQWPSDKYAVIVATSSGWANYRHQADALAVYRNLIENNWREDHIILISEDDLAYDPRNPRPGVVIHQKDGPNLRENVEVDYHPSELTDEDMCSILCGQASDALPEVLNSGPRDNVLVFWCGHGSKQKGFNWLDRHVSGSVVNHWLKQMKQAQKFHRLLFVAETCYSGGVGAQCADIPGVLMLTSTNENEPSFADVSDCDLEMQTYLSNGFGSTFINSMDMQITSLYDVYTKLVQGTQGSHVSLYGVEGFGSLRKLTMFYFVGDPN